MKANTVEQFKLIEYIKNNFEIEKLNLELLSRNSIKVVDPNLDSMIFMLENGQVLSQANDINIKDVGSEDRSKNKISKEAYNTKEAAAILGVCENTMRELIYRKSFPKIKVGRRILIPKEAFHRWVNTEGVTNSL